MAETKTYPTLQAMAEDQIDPDDLPRPRPLITAEDWDRLVARVDRLDARVTELESARARTLQSLETEFPGQG